MRIVKLETFGTEFVCFVRATAEGGEVGWGQCSTYQADITAQVFHRQIAPHALGCNPLDFADTLQLIQEREHKFPGSYLRRARPDLTPRSGICAARSRASRWPVFLAAARAGCGPMPPA
jgi:L-alanine-DL-glutamate epimerase-like enolase superfamily enzyme